MFNYEKKCSRSISANLISLLEEIDRFNYPLLSTKMSSLGDLHNKITVRFVDNCKNMVNTITHTLGQWKEIYSEMSDVISSVSQSQDDGKLVESRTTTENGCKKYLQGKIDEAFQQGKSLNSNIEIDFKAEVLGYYTREKGRGVVVIKNVGDENVMVSTYIHEMMHAYFDETLPTLPNDVPYAEEALAEYGMLHFLKTIADAQPMYSPIFESAYEGVVNKRNHLGIVHYSLGASIFDLYPDILWEQLLHDNRQNINVKDYSDLKDFLNQYPFVDEYEACNLLYKVVNNQSVQNLPPTKVSALFGNLGYQQDRQKSLLNNASRIFNRMPNRGNNLISNVGLVVGKVQSGKTANVITLSALAMDHGYRMVILFLSDTNILLNQNYDRFKKSFSGVPYVSVTQKSKEGDFDPTYDAQSLNYLYNQGESIVICCLKHAKHIKELKDILSNTSYINDYTLIIDDEADDIGLNTKAYKKRFAVDISNNQLVEDQRTATNNSIVELRKVFKGKSAYIALTATPEANILLQSFQNLSPDYCALLQPGPGYTGINTFHYNGSQYIVPADDGNVLMNNRLSDTIKDAIYFFFAGCIRHTEMDKGCKHSMMIHPDSKKIVHADVHDLINTYVLFVKRHLTKSDTIGNDIVSEVQKYYTDMGGTMLLTPNYLKTSVLDVLKLHKVNSEEAGAKLSNAMQVLPYHIIVGGNMLDRGLTIEGLAVSHMIRSPQRNIQMDTMLQRARWFGYKDKYLCTCRVYMPSNLIDSFQDIMAADDEVWNYLEYCEKNYISLKNHVPFFVNHNHLKMTSAQKVKCAAYCISDNTTQRFIVSNSGHNSDNVTLVSRLNWSGAHDEKYGKQIHRRIHLSNVEFINFINSYKFAGVADLSDVYKFVVGNRDVDVLDMRYRVKENRSTKSSVSFEVAALLQGYSENLPKSDPNYYVGDRYIKGTVPILQIHHVLLKNDICQPANNVKEYSVGDEVIMLNLVLPNGENGNDFMTRMSQDQIRKWLNL